MFSYSKEIGELGCVDRVLTVGVHRYRHGYRHRRIPLKPLTLHETMSDNYNNLRDDDRNDVIVPVIAAQHNIIHLKKAREEEENDRDDSFDCIDDVTPIMGTSIINIDAIDVTSPPSDKGSDELIRRIHTHVDDDHDGSGGGDDDDTPILSQNTSFRRSFVQVDR